MTACPDKELLLHALVDDELDVGAAAELHGHIAVCAGCAGELETLRALKVLLGDAALIQVAPPAWRARALAALPVETSMRRGRPFAPWLMGGAVSALAASLALYALIPAPAAMLPTELVEGHIRSLQVQHLVDVQTSDRHVVKPWFNGKIDFAPPVIDLVADGFPLAGGRMDYIGGRTVAALVYRRRAHVINLFVWPGQAPSEPAIQRRKGYTLIRWGRGGLVYWAVSDIDPPDLAGFEQAFVRAVPP